MKKLYAIPTHKCNLSCPHCTIRNSTDDFNYELFMKKLNSFDGHVILFGGEPTYDLNRLYSILHNSSNIGSISTNLVFLNNELVEEYKKIGYIATSWNYTRFLDSEYKRWLHNLERLSSTEVNVAVLITLTEDLIHSDMNKFLSLVDTWPSTLSGIRFEYLIDDSNTEEYYEEVDQWLLSLYKVWRSPIKVDLFEKNLKWYHDCSQVYTLEPNGTMIHGCPNSVATKRYLPSSCLSCDKSSECRPCILQKYCSYPHNLFNHIKED